MPKTNFIIYPEIDCLFLWEKSIKYTEENDFKIEKEFFIIPNIFQYKDISDELKNYIKNQTIFIGQ